MWSGTGTPSRGECFGFGLAAPRSQPGPLEADAVAGANCAAGQTFDAFLAEQLAALHARLLAEHTRRVSAREGVDISGSVANEVEGSAKEASRITGFAVIPDGTKEDGCRANGANGATQAVGVDSATVAPVLLPAALDRGPGSAHIVPSDSQNHVRRGSSQSAALQGRSQSEDTRSLGLRSQNGTFERIKMDGNFDLLDIWQEDLACSPSASRLNKGCMSVSSTFSEVKSLASQRSIDELSKDDMKQTWLEKRLGTKCMPFVAHPNSKARLVWDIFGMFLIAYDVIWVPLQVFEPATNLFTLVMDWVHIAFWTTDIPMSFFVGFFHRGRLVVNLAKIARRYLTTWFPLDFLLVASDWFIAAMEPDDGEQEVGTLGLVRVGKTVRFIKVLRIFRLLRLLKMRRYFVLMEERIQSRAVLIVMGICKMIVMILVANHFIACVWWLAGITDPGSGYTTWVEAHEPAGQMRTERLDYRYTTSLHWSLTQFTPAGMEVYARNPLERFISIMVLVFALVTFSSFVSSITNAMNQLRSLNSEYVKQLLVLQRFLRSRSISTELSVRMTRHLEFLVLRKNARIEEKDVDLLKLMSDPLITELHMEVYMQVLHFHPLLDKFADTCDVGVRKLCHTGVQEITMARRDTLFSVDDVASKVYFLQSGLISYILGNFPMEDMVKPISDKNPVWLCEACLWTEWRCCGEAMAFERCIVLALDATKFWQVMRQNSRRCILQPAKYAELFVRHLNTLADEELTDLRILDSELQNPFDVEAAVQVALQPQMPVANPSTV